MALCLGHPKRDQNPKFTPLGETTSIPVCFIWESPPAWSDSCFLLPTCILVPCREVKTCCISQMALSLFTYTNMKFLSFLTQRLSFCSTNVVKAQVSSIFKEKRNFINTSRIRSRSTRPAIPCRSLV